MTHKVLVADDEPNIGVSLEYLLRREGYGGLLAADGDEALATLRRERPALVLLDVMMPGRTGFEVCQEVRADPELEG
ncbi:response regulator, partial [Leclercia adecarboxylata]|uniref:response regulator n=1 Tax=Leclercia adecarboxylata TaxID=83655 RepID=UPI00234D53B7